jgi:hypothetical protein
VLEPTNKRKKKDMCKKKRQEEEFFFAKGGLRALGRGRRATASQW